MIEQTYNTDTENMIILKATILRLRQAKNEIVNHDDPIVIIAILYTIMEIIDQIQDLL